MAPHLSLLSRLILRRDGQPRSLARRLIFRGDTGLPRLPFRRTLFKKSGAARPTLSPQFREFLDRSRLSFWVETVDRPRPAEAAQMAERPRDMLFILDPGPAQSTDLQPLGDALRALTGVRQVRLAAWPPGRRIAPSPALDGIGIVTLDPAAPPESPVFVLTDGSLPSAHGPWLIGAALDSRVIAFGDEVEGAGRDHLHSHWFKPPTWSPLLAAQGMLLDGLVGLDLRDLRLREVWARAIDHGLRTALAGAAGRFSAADVAHVARVCAFRPGLKRLPLPLALPLAPDPLPRVAIIIPTRDRWDYLGPCLGSLAGTDWPADRMEIIVVDNGSTEADCLEGLAEAQAQGRIRVIRCDEPFNFSRLNNIAVRSTDAELLVFLNNDTTARRPDWLRILAAHALQPDVGAVGPKLLYPDGTVQHGGLVLGMEGGAVNAFVGLGLMQGGYGGLANLTREISAVVGACLCIRREVFLSVGGFNEALAVGFNDMVLCMDVLARQLRNVFVAEPLFFHMEYVSRGRDTTAEKVLRLANEQALTTRLHPDLFACDGYYSANLSRRVLFMLPGSAKEPPRLSSGPAILGVRLPRKVDLV